MTRLKYLLAALLYLAPQVGVSLHEAAAVESCAECAADLVRFECDDRDCQAPGHHHHEHRHHHPGNCRVCGSADLVLTETYLNFGGSFALEAPVTPQSVPAGNSLVLTRAIRGPPATGLPV